MVNEDKINHRLYGFLKRFLVILVVTGILLGTFMLENEQDLRPKPSLAVHNMLLGQSVRNKSLNRTKILSKTHTTQVKKGGKNPPPFNYLWTKSWGKQNAARWKHVYGDLNCPENSRRKILIKIFRRWIEIAEKLDIKYSLTFGSLLGVIRVNDVLPWDHDMDIVLEYKDILKLEKVGWPRDIHTWDGNTYVNYIPNSEHNKTDDDRLRWNCQGKLVTSHVDQCAIQEPLVRLYNKGVFLDVFDYFVLKDTLHMFEEGKHTNMRKKDYFPLRRCIFMGFDTWCPNNPENILKIMYGEDFNISRKKCKYGHWV